MNIRDWECLVMLESPEEYDAELERMCTAMADENLNLQIDNKQLGTLLKEYEQTLEHTMTTFRKRAVRLSLYSSIFYT